jgi:hypothetical protein
VAGGQRTPLSYRSEERAVEHDHAPMARHPTDPPSTSSSTPSTVSRCRTPLPLLCLDRCPLFPQHSRRTSAATRRPERRGAYCQATYQRRRTRTSIIEFRGRALPMSPPSPGRSPMHGHVLRRPELLSVLFVCPSLGSGAPHRALHLQDHGPVGVHAGRVQEQEGDHRRRLRPPHTYSHAPRPSRRMYGLLHPIQPHLVS